MRCLRFHPQRSALSSVVFCSCFRTRLPVCGICHVNLLTPLGERSSDVRQSKRHYPALYTSHTYTFVDWYCRDVQHCNSCLKCESAGETKRRPALFLTCIDANTVLVVSSDLLHFNHSFCNNRKSHRYFVHTLCDHCFAEL